MNSIELSLRAGLSFLVLLALARVMGRKELSQMTFFNFVSAVAIGSIGANLAVSPNLSVANGVLALMLWAVFTLAMGFIDIKSIKARKLLTGNPVIVIKDGKILEDALRRVRVDLESLKALLRQKSIFQLSDVKYAVFETDGQLSVMKNDSLQPITRSDMKISKSETQISVGTGVISDGTVLTENLAKLKLDQPWLDSQLKQAGIDSPTQVFYAEVQSDGSLYIDQKDDQLLH